MRSSGSGVGRGLGALLVTLVVPGALPAQLISLKTLPVAAGDQFLFYPSRNIGMGGVGIAIGDPWLDPFINPATGARVVESQVFAAPTFYSISNRAGNARTLPTGAVFRAQEWFGGGAAVLQQLERGERFFTPIFRQQITVLPPDALSQRTATNKYGYVSLGRRLAGGVAVAGGAFLADLGAMDGVEHLYAMAANIAQAGSIEDVRLGVTKDWPGGRTLEAVGLYHHFNMTHDVTYVDWVLIDSTTWEWEERTRIEHNVDRTRTWGLHLTYRQPIGTDGWHVGGTVTGNRKSHPKIPNYEIMNIPRDPGHSNAFDIGLGIAKVTPTTTVGLDVVYQPAFSETWAEAEQPVETASGDTIPIGAKTVENSFRFSNAFVRVGVTRQVGPAAFQLGLQVRAHDYHLDQWDHVEESTRRQDEQWMEWVPSWGATVRLADFELRYLGRVTTGTGRPGVAWTPAVAERAMELSAANDIVVAPEGPLTLQNARVLTHQVSVSLPIR